MGPGPLVCGMAQSSELVAGGPAPCWGTLLFDALHTISSVCVCVNHDGHTRNYCFISCFGGSILLSLSLYLCEGVRQLTRACMYAGMKAYTCRCVYMYICTMPMGIRISVCIYVGMYTCWFWHRYVHVSICTYACVYICVYM